MQYFRKFVSIHHDLKLYLFLNMHSWPFQFNPRPTAVENIFNLDYDYIYVRCKFEKRKKMHVSETRTGRHLV